MGQVLLIAITTFFIPFISYFSYFYHINRNKYMYILVLQ
jgi:hypothetical protein